MNDLALLDDSNQLGNSGLQLLQLFCWRSEWNSGEKWGLSSMQVSACVSQVLGNEPNELPKVCGVEAEASKAYTNSSI